MELRSLDWSIAPLEVETARCRYFDDRERFPAGSIQLDCGLVMREIAHEWRSRPDLRVAVGGRGLTSRER